MLGRGVSRGDTLVEVMFAVAVFSLAAVGSLSIMNQGAATAERALEVTLVRQEIDSQAETLRFLNSSYITAISSGEVIADGDTSAAGQWNNIDKHFTVPSESSFSSASCRALTNNNFILDTHLAKLRPKTDIESASTFSQVVYDSAFSKAQGIWITAVKPPVGSGIASYIDFHIEACWDSPGQSLPMTLGTIVRLYEP